MIRPIGDLVSECFYAGALRSSRQDGLRGYDLLGKPVLWIDTSRLGNRRREDKQDGGTSYTNRTEARLVVDRLKVIESAIEKGVVGDRQQVLHALLIAPYSNQIEEIKRRVSALGLKHIVVDVQSVDAVQGRESDVAIFSVTRSNSDGRMGFLGHEYWRRINVALSRARFGLTIVGDAEFCRASPGALRQVLHYMDGNRADCEIRLADNA